MIYEKRHTVTLLFYEPPCNKCTHITENPPDTNIKQFWNTAYKKKYNLKAESV
jgi:hypothetical protein